MRVYAILAILTILTMAAMPIVFIARARVMNTDQPRIHIIQDMDNQPKYKAQHPSAAFRDGRAMRPAVSGAVARGEANLDDHYYRGRIDGAYAATFPQQVEISVGFIERGKERYEIFCATCHGITGAGNGPISQRAEQLQEGTWTPPLSYHEKTVIEREHGHIFNTITNGIRNMAAYGDQIPVEDRWAIVAYIRALQRSQNATIDDVPADKRQDLLDQIQ